MVKLRRIPIEGGACRQVLKYGARRPDQQLVRNAFESGRMHADSSCARKERQRRNEIMIQNIIHADAGSTR